MNRHLTLTKLLLTTVILTSNIYAKDTNAHFPDTVTLKGIALNPEGIEYDKRDKTFLLSSINAIPITKVDFNGTHTPFTSGEKFPMSTAGLQIDRKNNRLLAATFNGLELMDNNDSTKGASHLRVYNLKTGVLEQDIPLSSLAPKANVYFANDIAIDEKGNAYVSDWYANVIYKVNLKGEATLFWENTSGIAGGPNGLDFHKDGYLLISLLKVNDKGLYSNYGLVKIPVDDSKSAKKVTISDPKFTGFDGMVINDKGNVIGVTNNGKMPGGNSLIELSGEKDWSTAKVINSKSITPSTTVTITPEHKNYVINQDFTNNFSKTWRIERIEF